MGAFGRGRGTAVLRLAAAPTLPIAALALAALVAPAIRLEQSVIVLALVAIAGVAYSAKVWLEFDDVDDAGGTTFDATVIVALVALCIAGPLAALVVWVVPDILHRVVFRRTALVTSGLLFNLASFVGGVAAGELVLRAVDDPAAAIYLAGATMIVVNFALSPFLYAAVFETSADRRHLLRTFVDLIPVKVVMLGAGTVTALLAGDVGLFALLLLSIAVALPEVRWHDPVETLRSVFPQPSFTRERDPQVAHTAAMVDVLVQQVEAAVATDEASDTPVARPDPASDSLEADLVRGLVAMRRLANRADVDRRVLNATAATMRLLERRVGPRHLRALPPAQGTPPPPQD